MKYKILLNKVIIAILLLNITTNINFKIVNAQELDNITDYTIMTPEVSVDQAGLIDKVVSVEVLWNMPETAEPDAYGFVVCKAGPKPAPAEERGTCGEGQAQAAIYYPAVSGFEDLTDSGFYYDEAVVIGDTYTYYVRAYDRSGVQSAWGSATITLTGFTISNIKTEPNGTDMKISWETDYETQGFVEYGLDTNYGKTTDKTELGFVHLITLTNLEANKTYHYRIKATAYDGTVCE